MKAEGSDGERMTNLSDNRRHPSGLSELWHLPGAAVSSAVTAGADTVSEGVNSEPVNNVKGAVSSAVSAGVNTGPVKNVTKVLDSAGTKVLDSAGVDTESVKDATKVPGCRFSSGTICAFTLIV